MKLTKRSEERSGLKGLGARAKQRGGKVLRRLSPAGLVRRVSNGKDELSLSELGAKTRSAVQNATGRGKEALSSFKERLPETREIRHWTSDRFAEHPWMFATGAIAAGLLGASMVPMSDEERRGVERAVDAVKRLRAPGRAKEQLVRIGNALRDRFKRDGAESEGAPEEMEMEPEQPRRSQHKKSGARSSGRKRSGTKSAQASSSSGRRRRA